MGFRVTLMVVNSSVGLFVVMVPKILMQSEGTGASWVEVGGVEHEGYANE